MAGGYGDGVDPCPDCPAALHEDHRSVSLYWCDRDSRFHAYDVSPTAVVGELLAEVDRDPTAIFWG